MRVSILSSRDTVPNVVFTLSFNVTFGPPSLAFCRYGSTAIITNKRDHPNLSREVIRSQYVNSSQPDMTRVTVKVEQPLREERTYVCQVTVEGRVNIVSGTYEHDTKGSGVTNVTITGKFMIAFTAHTTSIPPLSCRHPHWCHCQQKWLYLCPGLLDCPITSTSRLWGVLSHHSWGQ